MPEITPSRDGPTKIDPIVASTDGNGKSLLIKKRPGLRKHSTAAGKSGKMRPQGKMNWREVRLSLGPGAGGAGRIRPGECAPGDPILGVCRVRQLRKECAQEKMKSRKPRFPAWPDRHWAEGSLFS